MPVLTTVPIELAALVDEVCSPERGAVATFLGTVRNHHEGRPVEWLDYTAYAPMAEDVTQAILEEARARWPVSVSIRHRIGHLVVGEAAVAVAVAADHREEAFAACRYVIEEVKRRVPIWKHEHYADGSSAWVDPTAKGVAERQSGAVPR